MKRLKLLEEEDKLIAASERGDDTQTDRLREVRTYRAFWCVCCHIRHLQFHRTQYAVLSGCTCQQLGSEVERQTSQLHPGQLCTREKDIILQKPNLLTWNT